MALDKRPIITAEDSDQLPAEFQGWIWLKPSTGELHRFSGGSWIVIGTLLALPITNIDASGTVEANKGEFAILEVNGETGIDREVVIGAETFKFKVEYFTR